MAENESRRQGVSGRGTRPVSSELQKELDAPPARNYKMPHCHLMKF